MTYFDGFLAAVPQANKDAYLEFSRIENLPAYVKRGESAARVKACLRCAVGGFHGKAANRINGPNRAETEDRFALGHARSKRSAFMTLFQAAMKSSVNFSLASSQA